MRKREKIINLNEFKLIEEFKVGKSKKRVNLDIEKIDKRKKREEEKKKHLEEINKKVNEAGVKKIAKTLGNAREKKEINKKDLEKATKLLISIKGSDKISKKNKKTAERIYDRLKEEIEDGKIRFNR